MEHTIEHIDNEVVVCYGDDFLIESNPLFFSQDEYGFNIGVNVYENLHFTKEELKAVAQYILKCVGE